MLLLIFETGSPGVTTGIAIKFINCRCFRCANHLCSATRLPSKALIFYVAVLVIPLSSTTRIRCYCLLLVYILTQRNSTFEIVTVPGYNFVISCSSLQTVLVRPSVYVPVKVVGPNVIRLISPNLNHLQSFFRPLQTLILCGSPSTPNRIAAVSATPVIPSAAG